MNCCFIHFFEGPINSNAASFLSWTSSNGAKPRGRCGPCGIFCGKIMLSLWVDVTWELMRGEHLPILLTWIDQSISLWLLGKLMNISVYGYLENWFIGRTSEYRTILWGSTRPSTLQRATSSRPQADRDLGSTRTPWAPKWLKAKRPRFRNPGFDADVSSKKMLTKGAQKFIYINNT